MKNQKTDNNISKILEVIQRMASKDFSARVTISEDDSIINAIGVGINKLGEEMEATQKERNHEILELDKANMDLKLENSMMNMLMDNLPDNLYFKDRDSKFLRVSKSMAKYAGFQDVADLYGKMDQEIFHGEHAEEALLDEQEIIKTGNPLLNIEEKEIWKDGRETWVSTSKFPIINEKGDITGTFGISKDITDRKVFEAKLEEAKTIAESANRAKSEFLANMSHEIRTPMNSILGFSEILEEQLVDNAEHLDYIQGIRNSGKNLLRLINDILDLSKIEAGRLEIKYEHCNPVNILSEIEQIFLIKTNEKKLDFHVYVDSKVPRGLLFDEIRLRQIFFNLIGNAVKFTSEGRICVNVISEVIDNDMSQINLLIEVIDTGIGIPKEEQTSIFKPFQQMEGQSNRKYGGTGLGLSITTKLVNMMGGTIKLRSTPGQGSTFSVIFPRLQVSESGKDDSGLGEKPQNILFENSQILLVEDIESNRKVIKAYLSTHNITIVEAENGSIGVDKAKDQLPDLILMDIQMPVMDGYEASRAIKSDEKLKNIPIVALTASIMENDVAKISSLCDGLLRKPVSKCQLISELKKFLPYSEEKLESEGSVDNDSKFFNDFIHGLSGENKIPDGFIHLLNLEIIPEYLELLKHRSNKQIRKFAELISETGKKQNMVSSE